MNFALWSQGELNKSRNISEIENSKSPSSNSMHYNSINNTATPSEVEFDNTNQLEDSLQINQESSRAKRNQEKKELKDQASATQAAQIKSTHATFNSVQKKAKNQSTQRSPNEDQQIQLDQLSRQLMSIDSTSFEAKLSFYEAGNYDTKRASFLKEAEKVLPKHPDVLKYNVANSLIEQDTMKSIAYLNNLVSQEILTPEIQSYGEDMLQSACGNTTLVTHGFIDTYGATFKQLNAGSSCEGHNLTIVSLDFLQSKEYRQVLHQKGYELPLSEKIDIAYLKDFCEKNEGKNIALSMTIPRPYLEPLVPKLFPIGIVFEYRSKAESSFEEVEICWNQKLNKKNIRGYNSPTSNSLSSNYLPSMILLMNYYRDTGQAKKEKEMELEIQFVKQKAGLSQKKKGN